jgi:hypothetical protein
MPAKKKQSQTRKDPRWLPVLAAVLLIAPVCFPLLTSQLPSGHDTFSYHPRLVEFHENIAHGILLPRWAPDLEAGAGQPLFLFSPPLPYYAAEMWHLLGFNSVVSFNLVAIAAIVASAWFMFLFADYHFGRKAGWLAMAAYAYAPYFHVDIFVRHAFAELLAFPLYPLTLYGFSRYSSESKWRFLIIGALAWSGILLTHNPSALLFSPVLLGFIGFLGWKNKSAGLFIRMLGGILIGLGTAAFVWLPILGELKFVYIERTLQGDMDYVNHFVSLPQLWSGKWGYGSSVPGSQDDISFSLGWGHLLLIPATAWFIYTGRKGLLRIWLVLAAACLAVLAFMMTPSALWFWEHLPLLKQVQFPWRILGNCTVVIAILAALYGASLRDRKDSTVWFSVGMALLILPNLRHIGPERYYPIRPEEWTAVALAQAAVETTAGAEFEPRWVKERAAYAAEKIRVISGTVNVSGIQTSPTAWNLETNAATDAVVEAVLLYFPGWTVSVDNDTTPITIPDTGRIQFQLPAGTHHVEIEFRRTSIRLFAEILSLLTLLIVMMLTWSSKLWPK